MLFLETDGQRLTVLPTHRIVRALGDDGGIRGRGRAGIRDHARVARR